MARVCILFAVVLGLCSVAFTLPTEDVEFTTQDYPQTTFREEMVMEEEKEETTAAPSSRQDRGLNTNIISQPSSSLDLFDKMYQDCYKKDSISCYKLKTFTYVEKLLRKANFQVSDSVAIVRNPDVPVEDEEDAEASIDRLPRSMEERDKAIDGLLVGAVDKFVKGHVLRITLNPSDLMGSARGFVQDTLGLSDGDLEARKKKLKMFLPILLLGGLKVAAIVPLIFGAIALLAGKALLLSKLSLLISAIIGLKKLFAQKGHHGEHHQSYSAPSYEHHYSRSLDVQQSPDNWDPHRLAYNTYQ